MHVQSQISPRSTTADTNRSQASISSTPHTPSSISTTGGLSRMQTPLAPSSRCFVAESALPVLPEGGSQEKRGKADAADTWQEESVKGEVYVAEKTFPLLSSEDRGQTGQRVDQVQSEGTIRHQPHHQANDPAQRQDEHETGTKLGKTLTGGLLRQAWQREESARPKTADAEQLDSGQTNSLEGKQSSVGTLLSPLREELRGAARNSPQRPSTAPDFSFTKSR